MYILLDSNVGDVAISKDRVEVNKVLGEIQQGKICDPWNQGYYADFTTDDSGFYNSEAGWDSLKIKTFSWKSPFSSNYCFLKKMVSKTVMEY